MLGDLYDLREGRGRPALRIGHHVVQECRGGHLDLMTCEVVFERLGAKLQRGRHLKIMSGMMPKQ